MASLGKGKFTRIIEFKGTDLCNIPKSFSFFLPNLLITPLQVLYKNYFDTREKRKEEMDAYFESSFPKKGIKDLETSEYPVKGTNV